MREIDWFAIDMDAMKEKWNAYLDACERVERLDAMQQACADGECEHDRPLRKDGRPHKGRECPQGYGLYNEWNRSSQSLVFDHASSFWESIGLGYETHVKASRKA